MSEENEKYKLYLNEKLTDISNAVLFDKLLEYNITQLEYDSALHNFIQNPEFASKYQNIVRELSEAIDF